MTFQIKEGQAFLFKNDVPEGSNKPPFKGNLMIGGVEYALAFWGSKSGKDGSYSGKVSLPFKPQQQENHKGFTPQGDVASSNLGESDEIAF